MRSTTRKDLESVVNSSPVKRSQVGTLPAGSDRIRLIDASDLARVIVRGAPGSNLVTQLSSIGSGRSVVRRSVRIGRVRPNEWLYIGPADDVAAAVADLDLTGHTSVTDVSHARSSLRLAGRDSRSLLERCCSVDFSDVMFPNEAMVIAAVASVRCDIVRDDIDGDLSYLLTFDRSYSEYMGTTLAGLQSEFESS